ncbi:hypothetical protein Q3C01_31900 [Bradyrhizobium sp. UFLA05-109]
MHIDVYHKHLAASGRIRVHAVRKTIMLQRGKGLLRLAVNADASLDRSCAAMAAVTEIRAMDGRCAERDDRQAPDEPGSRSHGLALD